MTKSKLFQNSKQATTVGKYLKSTSAGNVGEGIESSAHLSESIKRIQTFLPDTNYSDPENFVKYGSAEKYYRDSFDYITNYYPYDGSALEKVKFYNDLNPLEKYIFEEKYPTATGFISIGSDYGTPVSHSSGYFAPQDSTYNQYLQAKGGPYSGTIYSTSDYRVNNLGFCGPSGSTVEFFLRKNNTGDGYPAGSVSGKEVVVDIWNGVTSSAPSFGRMTILCKSGSQDRFYVTLQSGTHGAGVAGVQELPVPTTGGLNIADGQWRNYSFAFANSGSNTMLDFYVNGQCVGPQININSLIGEVTGALVANIGSLRGDVYGPNNKNRGALEGYGKLTGSIDEFRFWKKSRSGEEIGRHWFTGVHGGADKHLANVDLGLYYKFNEGITLTSSIDQIALDYSGRVSNGSIIGYDAQVRNTGSSINELSLSSIREVEDPIVRSSNIKVLEEKNILTTSGSNYDYTNNSRIINSIPSWIVEEDENNGGELSSLSQIVSSYFDTLFGQITALRRIKDKQYVSGSISGSINEFPHNERLIQGMGLEAPEIFENIGALELYSQRDEQINFDQPISNIKNSIYKNLYNNLNEIYKSKGTAEAIRNYIRCYGVGEDIISLNAYGNNVEYFLQSNYKAGTTPKKYADFSGRRRRSDVTASIYQYYDSNVQGSHGIIAGTHASASAFTIEYEALFPDNSVIDNLEHDPVEVVTASLFGFHTPRGAFSASVSEVDDLTWHSMGGPIKDDGLQVYAIKSPAEFAEVSNPAHKVRDVYFAVKNRAGTTLLTSDIYRNVYSDQKWNLALSVRNELYPFAQEVSGTTIGSAAAKKNHKFILELYGSNYDGGTKRESFKTTTTLQWPSGSAEITSSKRLYMGAHRTNYTGTVLENSDVHGTSLRYWTDYLPTGTVDLHARDADSYGRLNPYRQAYSFQTPNRPAAYIPEISTLALNWDFANVTGSDASGRFLVSDFSSGSFAPEIAATALITITGAGDLVDGQKFTIRDTAGRDHTFAIEDANDNTANNLIGVDTAQGDDDDGAAAVQFAAAINAGTCATTITAVRAGATVILTQDVVGARGNRSNDDAAAGVTVGDFTGGKDSYESSYQGILSDINLRQHTGRGDFFAPNDTPIRKQYVYTEKLQLPEYVTDDDMIRILDKDVDTFTLESRPMNYFFALEKSVYQSVSKRMLQMFASIDEFNNLIGEPVNKYRGRYKSLEKLRELFFRNVSSDRVDLQKYVAFYKWIDSSMGRMIEEMFPASARVADNVRTVIESHALERSKISYKYPGSSKRYFPILSGTAKSNGGSVCIDTPGWKFNHAPVNRKQSTNAYWWKYRAPRNSIPTPETNVSWITDGRQTVFNALRREVSGSQLVCVSSDILMGNKEYFNKVNNITDFTFGEFKPLPDIVDAIEPNTKKEFPFFASLIKSTDGDAGTFSGKMIAPFRAISSSIETGIFGNIGGTIKNVDFVNLHNDEVYNKDIGTPMQGPYTNEHVGGIQARHNRPLRLNNITTKRKESFNLLVAPATGAFTTIEVTDDGSFSIDDYHGKTITLSAGGVDYSATVSKTTAAASTSKTVIGISGSSNKGLVAQSLMGSLLASINADGLPVTVEFTDSGATASKIKVTSLALDNSMDAIAFAGTWPSTDALMEPNPPTFTFLANGTADVFRNLAGSLKTSAVGFEDISHGQYFRGGGVKSPVNISNIASITGSTGIDVSSGAGVKTLGNFSNKYEVVHGFGREFANMDFVFNNSSYYSSGIPSAFLTTPSMRTVSTQTGSADYDAPRQRSARITNKTIIATRFAAPGSKLDSKQQFRDVASDQMSPNNALPFRNLGVRKPYLGALNSHTRWGGFSGSSPFVLDTFRADDSHGFFGRQEPLKELNDGLDLFGFAACSITFSNAQFANGNTLTLNVAGHTYSAAVNTSVNPGSSTVTVIGLNGVSSGGGGANDAAIATALATSLSQWVSQLVGGAQRPFVPILASNVVRVLRKDMGGSEDGKVFEGALTGKTGVSVAGFAAVDPTTLAASAYQKASAMPHHKTQRNAVERIRLGLAPSFPPQFPPESSRLISGSTFDTGLITRPIPQADRSSWFQSLSGSDYNNYQSYVISSSRYPSSITIPSASLTTPGAHALGAIIVVGNTSSDWDGKTIDIEDALSKATRFTADDSVAYGAFSRTAGNPVVYTYGVDADGGVENKAFVAGSLLLAMEAANAANDMAITVSIDQSGANPIIGLRQTYRGTAGNNTIEGTAFEGGGSLAGASGFANGSNDVPILAELGQAPFSGTTFQNPRSGGDPVYVGRYLTSFFSASYSVLTGSGGQREFPWSRQIGFVPWQQLRAGNTNLGRYYRQNNLYEISPARYAPTFLANGQEQMNTTPQTQLGVPFRAHYDRLNNDPANFPATAGIYYKDQRAVKKRVLKSFIEPPVTSKYKPLLHQISTFRGIADANIATSDKKSDVSLLYSYGNTLMGFANKDLNIEIGSQKNKNHLLGSIRRPYEILRDNYIENVMSGTDGVNIIKMFVYSETIYPKDRYGYLSGTRSRRAFKNRFWRDDISFDENLKTSGIGGTTAVNSAGLFSTIAISRFNRQMKRMEVGVLPTPNSSSQGAVYMSSQQIWGETTGSSALEALYGSASIWPMDSYLYSDAVAANEFTSTGSYPVGIVGNLAAGELMTPWHGRPIQDTASDAAYKLYAESQFIGAQYIYTVPWIDGSPSNTRSFLGYAPGAAITRPPWTAGRERRFVDGPTKGQLNEGRAPFYDTYETWADDVRAQGQGHTIIPEFRISEHVEAYSTGSADQEVRRVLELTGASLGVSTGEQSTFIDRYSQTDKLEFLDTFIKNGSKDLSFNKYPKHLELKTDAIVKLLPYDGFYPVLRTVQIATMFSQSYTKTKPHYQTGENDVWVVGYSGASGSIFKPDSFRPLLRPFFAPGILYNSIKSGLAVDYPIRRGGLGTRGDDGQFHRISNYLTNTNSAGFQALQGPLSGALWTSGTADSSRYVGQIPGNTRRRSNGQFDWYNTTVVVDVDGSDSAHQHTYGEDIRKFFWSERVAFEDLLNPKKVLEDTAYGGIASSDVNYNLHRDCTGSISGTINDGLYKKAISNFLASVPEFFLKKKSNRFGSEGYLTKFVSRLGAGANENNVSGIEKRTVTVNTNTAYVMEIGLLKTEQFNLYSNPYAFGVPTATGSNGWDHGLPLADRPVGTSWPLHRGEFAPFTPPYYYGPSTVTITYMPTTADLGGQTVGEVSLDDIIGEAAQRTYVTFGNESGSLYDFSSGSFVDVSGTTVSTSKQPFYGWNRAWQNRMDIDASITIDNRHPIENSYYSPRDPNKWVIMPKWECPVLDFPKTQTFTNGIRSTDYDFSSSIGSSKTEFSNGPRENLDVSTSGMWHQYGTLPDANQGIYIYIKDITPTETETKLVGFSTAGGYATVKKLPKFVIDSERAISSLATLTGFDPDEVMTDGFEISKAKRVGQLASNQEKSISEAVIAMPYYEDPETNAPTAITLRANLTRLGPKVKEFRRAFTKYSLPPALSRKLVPMIPKKYPLISQDINPFSEDDYEKALTSGDDTTVPVIYLFEHSINLSTQDLADIWQGILPDIGHSLKTSVTSIDHYMPRSSARNRRRNTENKFPEILSKQIELDLPDGQRTGIPRPDLLDISPSFEKDGFHPEIKWLVFKVKQKGIGSYTEFMQKEIEGYAGDTYEKVFGRVSREGMTPAEEQAQNQIEDAWAAQTYKNTFGITDENGGPTYNWPYDYFSLIESAKITSKVGFRPDLDQEFRDYEDGEE